MIGKLKDVCVCFLVVLNQRQEEDFSWLTLFEKTFFDSMSPGRKNWTKKENNETFEEEKTQVSEHLVESNLQSVDSHGAIRLTQYTDQVSGLGWPGKSFEFPDIFRCVKVFLSLMDVQLGAGVFWSDKMASFKWFLAVVIIQFIRNNS